MKKNSQITDSHCSFGDGNMEVFDEYEKPRPPSIRPEKNKSPRPGDFHGGPRHSEHPSLKKYSGTLLGSPGSLGEGNMGVLDEYEDHPPPNTRPEKSKSPPPGGFRDVPRHSNPPRPDPVPVPPRKDARPPVKKDSPTIKYSRSSGKTSPNLAEREYHKADSKVKPSPSKGQSLGNELPPKAAISSQKSKEYQQQQPPFDNNSRPPPLPNAGHQGRFESPGTWTYGQRPVTQTGSRPQYQDPSYNPGRAIYRPQEVRNPTRMPVEPQHGDHSIPQDFYFVPHVPRHFVSRPFPSSDNRKPPLPSQGNTMNSLQASRPQNRQNLQQQSGHFNLTSDGAGIAESQDPCYIAEPTNRGDKLRNQCAEEWCPTTCKAVLEMLERYNTLADDTSSKGFSYQKRIISKGDNRQQETKKGETIKGEMIKGERIKGETIKGETIKGETNNEERKKNDEFSNMADDKEASRLRVDVVKSGESLIHPVVNERSQEKKARRSDESYMSVNSERTGSFEIERLRLGLQAGAAGDSLPLWATPSRTIADIEREVMEIHDMLLDTPNRKLIKVIERISDLELSVKGIMEKSSGIYDKFTEAFRREDEAIADRTKSQLDEIQKRITEEGVRDAEALSKTNGIRNELKVLDGELKKLEVDLAKKAKEIGAIPKK